MKLTTGELQKLADEIVQTPGWDWLFGSVSLPTLEGGESGTGL